MSNFDLWPCSVYKIIDFQASNTTPVFRDTQVPLQIQFSRILGRHNGLRLNTHNYEYLTSLLVDNVWSESSSSRRMSHSMSMTVNHINTIFT